MTAIFSVDKMRVFFSKSDVQCFQKDEVGFVHVSYYNFDARGLFRLYKSTIDFFFFKEKKNTTNSNNSCFCSLYMDTLREGNDIVSLVVYMDHIGSDHLKKVIFFLQCYLKLSYFHTRMH